MTPSDDATQQIFARLGEVPSRHFPAPFVAAVALVEDYGRAWALELAHRLELEPHLARGISATELIGQAQLIPRFRFALEWLLGSLVAGGWARRSDESPERVIVDTPLPSPARSRLRAEALALDPGNAASLDLLDAAGEAFVAVGRGERRGEEVLLGPAGMGLWARYFANDNALYAINNTVASIAGAHRVPAEGSFSILEVGAGGGSGAEALLSRLVELQTLDRLRHYRVTEPSPFFRRRSQRGLTASWPTVPLAFGDLDIDLPWREHAVEPGSVDLVFGVNVLHVAKKLGFSLGEALSALKPGGWLVLGECARPFPGQALAAELIFSLLEGFTDVELNAQLRPNPGFLTARQWRSALHSAGFAEVVLVPDVEAIAELTPNFLTAAVCARRGTV